MQRADSVGTEDTVDDKRMTDAPGVVLVLECELERAGRGVAPVSVNVQGREAVEELSSPGLRLLHWLRLLRLLRLLRGLRLDQRNGLHGRGEQPLPATAAGVRRAHTSLSPGLVAGLAAAIAAALVAFRRPPPIPRDDVDDVAGPEQKVALPRHGDDLVQRPALDGGRVEAGGHRLLAEVAGVDRVARVDVVPAGAGDGGAGAGAVTLGVGDDGVAIARRIERPAISLVVADVHAVEFLGVGGHFLDAQGTFLSAGCVAELSLSLGLVGGT